MEQITSGILQHHVEEATSALLSNLKSMETIFTPGGEAGNRIFHDIGSIGDSQYPDSREPISKYFDEYIALNSNKNVSIQVDLQGNIVLFPKHSTSTSSLQVKSRSEIKSFGVGREIRVWDDLLSPLQCSEIIRLFESDPSKHYVGNLFQGGKLIENFDHKKATELEISHFAKTDIYWREVERVALGLVTGGLAQYEVLNPGLRSSMNPFLDEGFRLKRYLNDTTEHHGFHVDSGHEVRCNPRRVLATLIYLNDIDEGGETAFLLHNFSVSPRCGRMVIFPTHFSYVHAGRRPISDRKYAIANFIGY